MIMTPDERWYEAVKSLKRACELLDGKLAESTVVENGTLYKKFTLVFNEEILDKVEVTEQEGA